MSGTDHERGTEARAGRDGDDGHAGAGGGRASRLRSVGLIAAGLTVAIAGPPARAALRVRRLRRAAAGAARLPVDIDLDGVEPPRRIVALGDSATAGYRLSDPEQVASRRVARALHLRDGRATRLRSVARNGATTADVLAEQVEAAADADVVLVGIGANDATTRRPSVELEADLTLLVERLREVAAPDAVLVIVGCPDLSVAPGLPYLVRPMLRWHVRRVARVQQRVADTMGVPLVPLPRDVLPPAVFADDGFHPGPLGHERVSARVLELL
jgi:lysophospholipase L1-like esterase